MEGSYGPNYSQYQGILIVSVVRFICAKGTGSIFPCRILDRVPV